MIAYQWTSAILAIVITVTILSLIRYNHLNPRIALWWAVLAPVIAVVGIFPELVDWIALKLGVHYPPTLVGLIGVGVILIKVLLMEIELSKERQRIRVLVQKVALLESQRWPGERC